MKKRPQKPKERTVMLGVNALARETGLAQSTVSKKMRQGCTADQIRIYAAMKDGRTPAAGSAPAPSAGSVKETAADQDYDLIMRGRQRLEDIDEAKLRRAKALADRQEIENAQKRGELVPVAYVRKWGSRFLVAARDEMLKGPSELQDALSAETDPVKCAAIMRSWVERVMGKFCQLERLWGTGIDEEQVA